MKIIKLTGPKHTWWLDGLDHEIIDVVGASYIEQLGLADHPADVSLDLSFTGKSGLLGRTSGEHRDPFYVQLTMFQLLSTLYTLGHELKHVQQHVLNELEFEGRKCCVFRGERYELDNRKPEYQERYDNAPWEKEAFDASIGLFEKAMTLLSPEQKARVADLMRMPEKMEVIPDFMEALIYMSESAGQMGAIILARGEEKRVFTALGIVDVNEYMRGMLAQDELNVMKEMGARVH